MNLTVTLPWPDKRLSPNKRLHWRAVAPVKAAAKALARVRALDAMGAAWCPPERPAVVVTFCPPDRRPRDTDNMVSSLKAALDGVRDAIGVDDSKWTLSIKRAEPIKGGAVIISIEGQQ